MHETIQFKRRCRKRGLVSLVWNPAARSWSTEPPGGTRNPATKTGQPRGCGSRAPAGAHGEVTQSPLASQTGQTLHGASRLTSHPRGLSRTSLAVRGCRQLLLRGGGQVTRDRERGHGQVGRGLVKSTEDTRRRGAPCGAAAHKESPRMPQPRRCEQP